MTKTKKLIMGAGLLFLATVLLIWSWNSINKSGVQNPEVTLKGQIPIVATIYSLGFLAERIGGDNVAVTVVTPPGAEPHDFEPTLKDLKLIKESKLLLVNGKGIDAWAEKLTDEIVKTGGMAIGMISPEEKNPDPHIWLDPVSMKNQAQYILDALIYLDPPNKTAYQSRYETLINDLDLLDLKYRQGLANCELKEIVVSHNAFSYLASRYGFTTTFLSGLTPEEEPSAKHLKEVTDLIRQKKISYVFFETLLSPKISETIARETGAKTLALNPLEGLTKEELSQNKDYFSIMEDNLQNLRLAMLCR